VKPLDIDYTSPPVYVVVWNPWVEKAKAMSDFGDDEVSGFHMHFCITTYCTLCVIEVHVPPVV